MAVSRAVELGAREFVIPTAGNAGGALAAYCARAGVTSHVFMPQDAPLINILEVQLIGADLRLVNGLINDAGREAAAEGSAKGWFDVSTLKEPYRVEGKKIMGYELVAVFNWELPDVIIYPTGGGTGLIGMWKAFAEMEALGWIGAKLAAYGLGAGRAAVPPWSRRSTMGPRLHPPGPMPRPSLEGYVCPSPLGGGSCSRHYGRVRVQAWPYRIIGSRRG